MLSRPIFTLGNWDNPLASYYFQFLYSKKKKASGAYAELFLSFKKSLLHSFLAALSPAHQLYFSSQDLMRFLRFLLVQAVLYVFLWCSQGFFYPTLTFLELNKSIRQQHLSARVKDSVLRTDTERKTAKLGNVEAIGPRMGQVWTVVQNWWPSATGIIEICVLLGLLVCCVVLSPLKSWRIIVFLYHKKTVFQLIWTAVLYCGVKQNRPKKDSHLLRLTVYIKGKTTVLSYE